MGLVTLTYSQHSSACFKNNGNMLLEGIQKLAHDQGIRAPSSVYVFKPKIDDKDCVAFTHISNRQECLRLIEILNSYNFNGVKIKSSVNKFYKFNDINQQSVMRCLNQ